jgi:hypothetical protein
MSVRYSRRSVSLSVGVETRTRDIGRAIPCKEFASRLQARGGRAWRRGSEPDLFARALRFARPLRVRQGPGADVLSRAKA